MNLHRSAVRLLVVLVLSVPAVAQDWNAFRGPNGDGLAAVDHAPLRWDSETNIRWKVAMPRPGNGSAIVSAGRVFVTSAEDEKGQQRSLYCFDRETGAKRWVRTAAFDQVMPTHRSNPYCGTTPAANGERVVVWRGSAGLFCYDLDGEPCWHRDLGEFRHPWGYGTSPLLHEGIVLLNPGAGKRTMVVAVSLKDGEILWQHDEPQAKGGGPKNKAAYVGTWSTPILVKAGVSVKSGVSVKGGGDASDGHLLVCVLPTRVVAFDPKTGKIVWSCDGVRNHRGDLAYSSPVVAGDLLIVVGGWEGPGLGIRLGGEGDITGSHRVWRSPIYVDCIGSGAFVDGSVYWPTAGGSIACIDPKTGDTRWRKAGARGRNWSSMVYAAGRLYTTNQAGTTLVLEPNDSKLEVIAKNELNETCNATAAFSEGEIFIRTHEHLYCISESTGAKPDGSRSPSRRERAKRAIR